MDEMETQMVEHLLHLSDEAKTSKEFQGFDEEMAEELLKEDVEDARVREAISPTPEIGPVQETTNTTFLKEGDIRHLVEQVVNQITPVIKSLCVTDRLLQTQVRTIMI